MRNISLLVTIVVIIIDGIAFRVDLSSNHNLEQRIQVNLVLIIVFSKASDSFWVSYCTSSLHVLKMANTYGALNHLVAALLSVGHELFV